MLSPTRFSLRPHRHRYHYRSVAAFFYQLAAAAVDWPSAQTLREEIQEAFTIVARRCDGC